MIGNFFSNGWKNPPVFPMIGKIFLRFSNDWKKVFQWLENSSSALPRRHGLRKRRA
jgi:hypothetical protein